MKRTIFFAAMIICLSITAHAQMYDDVKPAMTALVTTFHELEADLDRSQDADQVVNAFNTFIGAITHLKPQMVSLKQEYPELENALQTNPPSELLSLTKELKNARGQCLMTVQKVIAEYGNDPEVQKTYKYFEEIVRIR